MAQTSTPATRAPRADGARNRSRILAAAREAFADPDSEVSMAEIARRAGIGQATLYRNFDNRRDLLEALYTGEIDAVCAAAFDARGDTAGARLADWLRSFHAYFTSKRFVAAELLEHTDSADPVFSTGYGRVVGAASTLVEAARKSGEVRPDLTAEQMLALISAVAKIPGTPEFREPILQSALDSLLRPQR